MTLYDKIGIFDTALKNIQTYYDINKWWDYYYFENICFYLGKNCLVNYLFFKLFNLHQVPLLTIVIVNTVNVTLIATIRKYMARHGAYICISSVRRLKNKWKQIKYCQQFTNSLYFIWKLMIATIIIHLLSRSSWLRTTPYSCIFNRSLLISVAPFILN